MRKYFLATVLKFITIVMHGQVLYNNGATLQVTTGGILFINGGFTNNSGSLQNNGSVTVKGSLVNNQSMSTPYSGLLRFDGSTAQVLSGSSPFYASNVEVNNALGVTLNTPLRVNGSLSFTNGIITTSSASNPVIFDAGATYTGAADASHVNGTVIKEGTGSFTYPTGNALRLQPILVNATSNTGGIAVTYQAADAGSGTFTNTGTDPVPLVSYNPQEYWSITPVASATGTVTLYWDGYNDNYSNPLSQRRLAHKVLTSWLNEGGTTSGIIAAGNVTGNSVTLSGSFALGSVSAPLPLRWLSVSASINDDGKARLSWKVEEEAVKGYEVQKLIGGNFISIGAISSKGDGNNSYTFTENTLLQKSSLYRIMQIDLNGRSTFSAVMSLQPAGTKGLMTLFPNPVRTSATVSVSDDYLGKAALFTDVNGRILEQLVIRETSFTIDLGKYRAGIYYLKTVDGGFVRITKL
ncbi:MAG: hypothetical protein DI535_23385 [Citrobacter freundii]|nr:MAG: hypothetical protein DI535_23385 [Citrobacter freundii]